ncbi:MAG: DMT family transporter [Candidatus Shapirobacteria bacterium]
MNQQQSGYAFALVDMITYGLLPVVSHYFVTTIDPLVFSGSACVIGSIPLLFLLKRQNKINELFSKIYFPNLFKMAILSTIGSILYFVGAKLTSGLNTGLLTQLEPFYAMLLGILILKEIIKKEQILATTLMVIGAGVVVYKGTSNLNIGDIFILFSPLATQISHLFAKKVYADNSDSNTVPTARLLFTGILLLLISLLINPTAILQLLSFKTLLIVTFFGLIFRCLDFYLWYQAIARISVSRASAVIPVAVAVTFLSSIFIFKESISVYQISGLVLILGGLLWLSKISLAKINS